MNPFDKEPAAYADTEIPGSFYAVRHMAKGTKLVKSKQSPMNLAQLMLRREYPLTPSIGKRPRIKHRARTCMRVNRDING